MKPYYRLTKNIHGWKNIVNFVERENEKYKNDLIFRGINNSKADLSSSFDRIIRSLELHGKRIRKRDRWKWEVFLLYEFKRRAYFYLKETGTPNREDFLEWFSLMRHYGAPSRLVDFTHSFYVALYFAVDRAEYDSCIYGISRKWLVDRVENDPDKLVSKGEFFQEPEVFKERAMVKTDPVLRTPRSFIIPVRPFRSNERIHVQRGLFLCPANVNETFEDNLRRFKKNSEELKNNIFKLIVHKKDYKIIMKKLREMNISRETLYPGLQGFAESLKELLYTEKIGKNRIERFKHFLQKPF